MKVLSGKDLMKMDTFRKSDPYVVVKYKNDEFKSEVDKNTLNPTWNKNLQLDVDREHQTVTIQLFDWERFGTNEPMGVVTVNILDVINDTKNGPKWYRLENCKSGLILLDIKGLTNTTSQEAHDLSLPQECDDIVPKRIVEH